MSDQPTPATPQYEGSRYQPYGAGANPFRSDESPADRRERQAERRKFWTRRRHLLSFLMIALLAVLAAVIVAIAPQLAVQPPVDGKPAQVSELSLTVALVVGAAVLPVMIMAIVARFVTGRNGRTDALGLPDGSIGAIIALMLLLIFSLLSVFLFSQIRSGEGDGFISSGVSADALKSLPQDRILEVSVENPQADPAARTYRVKLAAAHPDSNDFAKTAALTVGTLLTAVAGCYFGQRATQSGVTLVAGKAGGGGSNGVRGRGAGPMPGQNADAAMVAAVKDAVKAEMDKQANAPKVRGALAGSKTSNGAESAVAPPPHRDGATA